MGAMFSHYYPSSTLASSADALVGKTGRMTQRPTMKSQKAGEERPGLKSNTKSVKGFYARRGVILECTISRGFHADDHIFPLPTRRMERAPLHISNHHSTGETRETTDTIQYLLLAN